MTIYLLSALLLSVLAFAIVQLSQKSEVEAEIQKLKQRNQLSLIAELRAAEKVVWLCFSGGLLLTANYAITYFSGSELTHIAHWGFIQWSGAFIGLVIAVSITFVQKVLYSSPTHSKAGLVVTTLVLTFVIISEIGSPIEKEGMKMKEASQNSAVFKAVVGKIQASPDASSRYSAQIATAMAEKAQHEFELSRCERHQSKGEKRVKRCEDYENKLMAQAQAKINSYQASASTATRSNESSRLSLIEKAKDLERNTDNHSEIVKLTASILGANFLASMMFLSLVLIVAFEAGFHFVGSRVGVLKATLGELGNKEILREQELVSLKRAKQFKDESAYIDPNNELNVNAVENAPTVTAKVAKTNHGHHTQSAKPNQENLRKPLSIPKILIPNSINKEVYIATSTFVPKDPADRVSATLSAGSTPKPKKTTTDLKKTDFNGLYQHVKQQIETGKISLSITNMRKVSHAYIKANIAVKHSLASIPETGYLVDKIKEKMLAENFIIDNPNYSNGKAKYLLGK